MKTKSKQQLKEENILLQRKVDRLREDKAHIRELLKKQNANVELLILKLGNIIKWGLIIFIVFSIGFLVWYNYSDSNLISQPQNSSAINLTEKFAGKVPQCSDGIDNDGDGFIDYPEDNDCSDKTDRTERDWSFIYWLLGGFLFASLWLLIIFKDDIQ